MPLFYDHQLDEEKILNQQSIELENWIEHFEFVAEEINYLGKLIRVSQFKKHFDVDLQNKKEENIYLLSLFYNYRNKSETEIESIDIPFDIYNDNQHELYRNQYLYFIRAYRILKKEIYKRF